MKHLLGILCVIILSLVISKKDVLANEAASYNSDASAGFYGEYKPIIPDTKEPTAPQTGQVKIQASIPQTGDSSNLPYVYAGLIILVTCMIALRRKMQDALNKHSKYKNY